MMNRTWIGLLAVALVTGCADGLITESGGPSGVTADLAALEGYRCPMHVPGATVSSTEVTGGAALTFVAGSGDLAQPRSGDLAQLRQRVQSLAELHMRYHAGGGMLVQPGLRAVARGEGHGPQTARGLMKLGSSMRIPAATATVEDIEGGARLAFWPNDATQLESLRAYILRLAKRIATAGECPMISARVEQSPCLPQRRNPSCKPGK